MQKRVVVIMTLTNELREAQVNRKFNNEAKQTEFNNDKFAAHKKRWNEGSVNGDKKKTDKQRVIQTVSDALYKTNTKRNLFNHRDI